jgi:signal transduction histidine kinase
MLSALLTYIPTIIGSAVLAGFAYFASNRTKTRTHFLFFVISVVAWQTSLLFSYLSVDVGVGVWFERAAIMSGAFVGMSFLLFSSSFPNNKKISNATKVFLWAVTALLIIMTLTPLTVSVVGTELSYGVGYTISTSMAILFILASVFILIKKRKINKKSLGQVNLILLGILTAAIVNAITNFVFIDLNLGVLGALSVLLFETTMLVVVINKGLFNFRLFAARAIAYLATVSIILVAYIAITTFITRTLTSVTISNGTLALFTIFSAIAALSFHPIKKYFDKFSNRLFYRDAYDAQELLNRVNSSLVSSTDLHKLLEQTSQEIKTNIKASFCNFYIDNKAVIDFHTVGTHTPLFAEEKWELLLKALNGSKAKIFSEEHGLDEHTSQIMHDLKADIILRLTSQSQNVGYLVVGQKQSGSSFTAQDAQILEIIADEVAIAVQNTLRYEEIALFNVTLQQKIKNATAELQHTNQKLKALDEAKDEFISMASHQLRTPLTSVKGYLSMLLENDAGKLNEQQRRFLNQAFISSQRMVYLIADLLNVSRLKTGKFVIEAKPTYLPDVVESELAQLQETAKARGLELIFDQPKEFPTLNLDETKIRQVIMNFADNAVHYTPKGGKITMELKQTDVSVELTVTDTGIGVPKHEQHKLFTKFYRAGNAKKARPDGTGLGLFMAKKVVVAQGGAIIFKTEENKGSVFGFTFPRAKLEIAPDKK